MAKEKEIYFEENGIRYEDNTKTVMIGFNPSYDFGRNIVLPDTVKVIGTKYNGPKPFARFYWPDSILTIPSSVEKINEYAFDGATLKKVVLSEGIKEVSTNAFACAGIKEISLPKSLKTICFGAFGGSDITKINLEDTSVEGIEENAFINTKLKYICIPETVKSLGAENFSACKMLKKVDYKTPVSVPSRMFSGCEKLEEISFNSNVKEIFDFAFYGCKKLKLIILPANLRIINGDAFSNSGLSALRIPRRVEIVGPFAFADCEKLENIEIEDSEEHLSLKEYCFANTAIECFAIPSSVNEMSKGILSGNKELKSVDINANTDYIPQHFTYCCPKLTDIKISNKKINAIGKEAFFKTGIETINEQFRNIEVIEEKAFAECHNLKSALFTMPVEIHDFIFANCENLEKIFIINSITATKNAFSNINPKSFKIFAPKLKLERIDKTVHDNIFIDKDELKQEIITSFPLRNASKIIEDFAAIERLDI